MFEQAVHSLKDIIDKYPWVSEVAAILPLSALIDFIDVPQKLHIHQLVSAVPLWSWPVTPSGSRLLLLEEAPKQRECVLDRFGRSVSLHGLDGRYGDNYLVSNPETVRLILDSLPVTPITNNHENMKESNLRLQNLEVVFVSRNHAQASSGGQGDKHQGRIKSGISGKDGLGASRSRWGSLSAWQSRTSSASTSYQVTSLLGWIALLGCLVASIFFRLHITTTFLLLMPATGLAVSLIYPGSPRRLLNSHTRSEYNRMVVVTEHMNAADWTVFYGESTLVNSLLNTPLEPSSSSSMSSTNLNSNSKKLSMLRTILRVMVLGQWGLAIAAAATKDWNAFFISFWIIFCNVTHGYVISPQSQAGAWASAKGGADLRLERYATTVSSRRALLSTLVALNPDSFGEVATGKTTGDTTGKREDVVRKGARVHVEAVQVSDGDASGSGSGSGSESEASEGTAVGSPSASGDNTSTGSCPAQRQHKTTTTEVTVKEEALPESPFPPGTTKFLDPILTPSKSRSTWEKATLEALREVMPHFFQSPQFPQDQILLLTPETKANLRRVENDEPPEGSTRLPALSEEWNARYKEKYKGEFYWKRFIPEGIYVAARIREEGGLHLSGRKVGFSAGGCSP